MEGNAIEMDNWGKVTEQWNEITVNNTTNLTTGKLSATTTTNTT